MSLTTKRKLSLSKRTKSKHDEYTTRDLPSLRRKRTIAFNRLSKALQIGNDAKLDATKLDLFLSYCDELKKITTDFENAHLLILELQDDPESDDEGVRESFDDIYFNILALQRNYTNSNLPSKSEQKTSSHIKLPKISLRTYSGHIKEWAEYIDIFNSLINDCPSLNNLEKFHYLRSSLSGEALALIRSYPVTGEYYHDAYSALVNRYKNKRDLAFTCWREILNVEFKINNVKDFRRSLDMIDENLNILKQVNLPVQQWDFILIYHLLSKLDTKMRREFEEKYSNIEIPSYKLVSEFLHSKCEAHSRDTHFTEQKPHSNSRDLSNVHAGTHTRRVNVSHTLVATNESKTGMVTGASSSVVRSVSSSCPFCSQSHSIGSCKSFLEKSVDERMAIVNEKRWCYNCLKSSHQLKTCNSVFTCQKCKRRHHTLLHREVTNSSNTSSLLTQNSSVNTTVLLATALVTVKDSFGNNNTFRALFDTGSQNNFITEEAVNRLNLNVLSSCSSISGLGDVSASISGLVRGIVGSLSTNNTNVSFELDMHVIPKICGDQPIARLNTSGWSHIKSLDLADPGFDVPGPVDLLLGADIFADSLLTERLKGGPSQPPAFNSVFGWLLLGKTSLSGSSLVALQSKIQYDDLTKLVEKFWEIDNVPQANSFTPDDILCEKEYIATTHRNEHGRYVVHLPFKNSCEPVFSGSRDIAERRFYALERRLSRDPDLKRQYVEFMFDYLQSGHMSLVPTSEKRRGKYYIPHHCVVRPDSPTTQLRVVFDASAKDNLGQSLNDTLLIGPKCQTDITKVLLRFREHAIVFMADIRQMYRQIVISPTHRDYQRILWRSDSRQPVSEYKLNTVTYGVSSAPFLACRTLQQLACDEGDTLPLAKRAITYDIYVDDIVTGANNMIEARQVKSQVVELLKSGHFELRKWASNKPELLDDVLTEHCLVEAKSFTDEQPCTLKVLGLKWDPSHDVFVFHVKPLNKMCTKRSILSEVSRVFDPLGFLSPLTIHTKILIQQLWVAGIGWDETPPDDIVRTWNDYIQQLPSIQNLFVPRRCTIDHAVSYELHGFCDSSEKAYGAVIYLRVTDSSDRVHTFFVCSKARVAPLKKLSLPRLELCAAVLLVNLLKFVEEAYAPRINFSVTLWSDSTVVLSWLRSHSSKWTTFVANRVSHIQGIATIERWRHVPTNDNPADICSRGQLPRQLINNSLWWAGPTWLCKPHTEWPSTPVFVKETNDSTVLSEVRRTATLLNQQMAHPNLDPFFEDLLNSDLSLDAIVDKVGFTILRKSEFSSDSVLTSEERYKSLYIIVKYVQTLSFPTELERIRSGQSLPKSFRKLNVFIDDQDVLRVGGRISRSGLEYEQKHPALLSSNNPFTSKLIQSVHLSNCHCGVNTTQYLILQQFWIISAKRVIRRCLSKCFNCYLLQPKPLQPFMSDLPKYRVNEVKPFSIVGVDYAGPFRIKTGPYRGAKIDKAYPCLFVCLATKAVHLETVSSLSTDGFIAALRRFVARRGRCSTIHADCGTNFIGARNQLVSLTKIASETERIEFKFNPPSAPHFGGVWEIQIRAAKTHLYRVVGDQVLTFEELATLFSQIEAVLNSRPLYSMSSDPNDYQVLTPGHFLTLEPLTSVPDVDVTHLNVNRLDRWQLIQSFQRSFWNRWRNEYLHSLNLRAKWTKESKPLELNSMVIIKDDNHPPLHWQIGRVVELHPGPDGLVRVATVRTDKDNLIKRPLVKLCPLPNEPF
ncbi:uncharacterized protein LOC131841587 [Achroia grisella]|uniref:uncharacterized protein LOC131841587 n=1 Tax=Achroia grisella TaxID=688607 RepID=UPI0027D281B4|nr:uncharacterized protein LOC131841587 [Achroia grisella]